MCYEIIFWIWIWFWYFIGWDIWLPRNCSIPVNPQYDRGHGKCEFSENLWITFLVNDLKFVWLDWNVIHLCCCLSVVWLLLILCDLGWLLTVFVGLQCLTDFLYGLFAAGSVGLRRNLPEVLWGYTACHEGPEGSSDEVWVDLLKIMPIISCWFIPLLEVWPA